MADRGPLQRLRIALRPWLILWILGWASGLLSLIFYAHTTAHELDLTREGGIAVVGVAALLYSTTRIRAALRLRWGDATAWLSVVTHVRRARVHCVGGVFLASVLQADRLFRVVVEPDVGTAVDGLNLVAMLVLIGVMVWGVVLAGRTSAVLDDPSIKRWLVERQPQR